jgi:RNA-binding protein
MMTSKKRAFLRKKAHELVAIVRIGKEGFSENIVQGVEDAILNRELIKVKVLQNCEQDTTEIAEKIAEAIKGEIIGIIGRTIILFKENKEKPTISLELKSVK